MPVRSRSAVSMSAMICRPDRLTARSSSISGSKPSRVNPPSRASAGGSSSSVRSMRCRTSARSSISAHRLRTSGAAASPRICVTWGMTPHDRASATKSRGPAVPSTTRPSRRSRSCSDPSASRSSARWRVRNASSSTPSSRSRMRSSSTSGRSSHARSRRPPMALDVRSISWSSEPSRWPSLPAMSSRWRQVTASMRSASADDRNASDCTWPRSALCESRRYRSRPPAARVAATRSRIPKPSRLWTRSCSRSAARRRGCRTHPRPPR